MKKLFLLSACILAFATAFSQNPVSEIETVNFYGVDFSQAKAFGVTETGHSFAQTFGRINTLILKEWDKYNPGKYLWKNIALTDLSAVTAANENIDPNEVVILSSGYKLSDGQIEAAVRGYELQESEGVGLVIICEKLDKSALRGSYAVVFFDIATRDIIYTQFGKGKPSGMGLRNYWAGSLYSMLKKWRYMR